MNLTQLTYFKAIATHENMTAAATALHVVQPALSRSLRELEKELGLLFFDRVGKNIVLNDHGRVMLGYATTILNQVDELQTVMADRKAANNQRVSLYMRAATYLLPTIISEFNAQHPDIAISVTQQKQFSSDVRQSDIRLSASMHPIPEGKGKTLLRESICLAIPLSHPLSTRTSVCLEEVAELPFVCLPQEANLRKITDAYCRQAGFVPKVVFESDNPAIVRKMIRRGAGLGFIPKQTWPMDDQAADIALVEIEGLDCFRYLYMSTPDNHYITQASKAFQKYLVSFFAKLQGSD